MPRDFVYEREADFLRDAEGIVGAKYVTLDSPVVRAFFRGGWWLCVYEAKAECDEKAKEIKDKFVAAGFTPITVKESPVKIF